MKSDLIGLYCNICSYRNNQCQNQILPIYKDRWIKYHFRFLEIVISLKIRYNFNWLILIRFIIFFCICFIAKAYFTVMFLSLSFFLFLSLYVPFYLLLAFCLPLPVLSNAPFQTPPVHMRERNRITASSREHLVLAIILYRTFRPPHQSIR